MATLGVIDKARDGMGAGAGFGKPVEADGVTIIPVARISGGSGEGSGPANGADESASTGVGGGMGVSARPVGVYLIRDGNVRWRPAIDVNRLAVLWAAV